jgi:hypothetical protein
MATQRLRFEDTAGVNNYFTVWRSSDNLIFDFNDNTFKAIASATTPYLAADENTNTGGTGRSHYTASLNLSLLGSVDAFVQAYRRSGSTPAPLTDATIEDPVPIEVRFGDQPGSISAEICATMDHSVSPEELFLSVTISLDGQAIDLNDMATAPTCAIQVRQSNPAADAFPELTATIDDDGRFVASQESPFDEDQAEKEFHAVVTVTHGSQTYRFDLPFSTTG